MTLRLVSGLHSDGHGRRGSCSRPYQSTSLAHCSLQFAATQTGWCFHNWWPHQLQTQTGWCVYGWSPHQLQTQTAWCVYYGCGILGTDMHRQSCDGQVQGPIRQAYDRDPRKYSPIPGGVAEIMLQVLLKTSESMYYTPLHHWSYCCT